MPVLGNSQWARVVTDTAFVCNTDAHALVHETRKRCCSDLPDRVNQLHLDTKSNVGRSGNAL